MADLKRTIEILFEGTNNTGTAITAVGRGLDNLNYRVATVAQPFADFTAAVVKLDAVLAGLAAAGLTYAFNESSKLQSAFTELKKVAGDNAEVLETAKANAKGLSSTYGEAASDILASTANYVQAGFSVKESMELAKTGMDLVIAGGVEAATSSEILISSLKGFKAPAEEAGRLLDILNEVSNRYATDIEQLGIGMATLSPIARTMGFSMEETAGLITPVIEVFRSGDEAANALKTGLLKLIDDTKPVQETLASIGVSQTDANGALRSGKDILLDVGKAFQTLDEDQKLFVTQQLVGIEQSARMVEVFDGLSKSTEITAVAMGAAGSAAKEVAERLKDPEVAVNRLVQGFKNLASSIGDDFQGAGTGAIDGITAVLNSLEDAVDAGAFDPLLDALNDFLEGVETNLKHLAEVLPEALEGVDYSGFLDSLGEIRDIVGNLFDGVDLSKPETLTAAIQKVVDTFESITRVSAGIGEVFVEVGGYISGLIDWFNGLDEGTQEFLGNIAGIGAAVSAIAVPIGVVTTAIGSLAGALTAAVAAGSLWAGLKIADTINNDFNGVNSVLTDLENSASDLREEIGKLEGTNSTLYKFFKGEDKEVVLDELRTKLQLVNDKIGIVKAEAAGENIFGGIEDDAASLKNALDHIAPKFTEIEDSAKELQSALEHNTPKFTIDTKEAEEKLQALEVWRESTGTWETIKVPMDTSDVEKAKKEIEEIPAVKRLEIETDLEIAKVKSQAETAQNALRFKAEVDIAEIEAAAEVAKAVAQNVSEMFSNTGDTLTDLVSMFGDDTTIAQDNAIYRAISEEQENRKKLLEQQKELNDAQVAYLNEKTRRLQSGEALITVNGDGLQPHLEMIMWELFEAIQIRATQEGLDQLNLGA